MNAGTTLLAVFEPLPQWLNFLTMFLALLLGSSGVLIWTVKFGKKRRHKHKHHKRHKSRDQRKPNPTLAETGGLPPARASGASAEPSPPP